MRQATLDKALLSQMLNGLWSEDNKSQTKLNQKQSGHHEAEEPRPIPVREKAPSFSLYRHVSLNDNFSCQFKEEDKRGARIVTPLNGEIVGSNKLLPSHREKGETLAAYMRRTETDLFLASIMKSGITDEGEIVKRSMKAYSDMARDGKYYNTTDVKRQREEKIAALRGALMI